MQRLLLVYNPHSSQFCHVKEEILNHPEYFRGMQLGKYEIKKIGFEKNVENFSKLIRDGDVVLAAGGDATAAITVNAIMNSKKDARLAVLPYGNFNDLARTLNTRKIEEVLANAMQPKKLYPLSIYVDGKFWRYASSYVTIGMTAEVCEIFDQKKIRKEMQKGRKTSVRSYFHMAAWYFKNRHKKTFLPEFTINGEAAPKGASDYAAVSGRSMCRVMKGGEDYLKPKKFRSMARKLTSFPKLFDLMVRSIFDRVPGNETGGDILEFLAPATVEIQAEGEYKMFHDIRKIEIRKDGKCLKIIQN